MSGLKASQEILRSAQFTALDTYISAGSSKLGEALDKFCKPVEDAAAKHAQADPSDVQDALTTSWKAILASAATDSWTWPRAQNLAGFVVELQNRPDVKQDGQPVQVEDMTVWKDLPTFGWQLRDAWNFAASDSDDQETQTRWTALNAFTATLVSALHSTPTSAPDFSLYGIWTLRLALEDSKTPANAALSAASVWFVAVAPTLWDFSRQEKTFEGKIARPGALYKDAGWTGFSRDRWRTWARRFAELQEQVDDEGTAEVVQQARQAMGDVEEE